MRRCSTTLPLLLLTTLLMGCAQQLPELRPAPVIVTRQINIPPLPASAQQVDSPGYLESLTTWRRKAQLQLTEQ